MFSQTQMVDFSNHTFYLCLVQLDIMILQNKSNPNGYLYNLFEFLMFSLQLNKEATGIISTISIWNSFGSDIQQVMKIFSSILGCKPTVQRFAAPITIFHYNFHIRPFPSFSVFKLPMESEFVCCCMFFQREEEKIRSFGTDHRQLSLQKLDHLHNFVEALYTFSLCVAFLVCSLLFHLWLLFICSWNSETNWLL